MPIHVNIIPFKSRFVKSKMTVFSLLNKKLNKKIQKEGTKIEKKPSASKKYQSRRSPRRKKHAAARRSVPARSPLLLPLFSLDFLELVLFLF